MTKKENTQRQTPSKSKLFKLKEWLTMQDAAQHLSTLFGEDVSEADVLRLALDGHLKLSVNFLNTVHLRHYGKILSPGELKYIKNVKDLMLKRIGTKEVAIASYKDTQYFHGEFSGIWYLPIPILDFTYINDKYNKMIGINIKIAKENTELLVVGNDGSIYSVLVHFEENEFQPGSKANFKKIKKYISDNNIKDEEAKNLLNKHEENRKNNVARIDPDFSDNYFPIYTLPDDIVLVVSTVALRELEDRLSGEQPEKRQKLGSKERESLLKIILGMAMDQYDYDPNAKKSPAPQQIADDMATHGLPLDVDTVRKYLKEASEIAPRG